jgi:hypothetical protein
MAHHMQAPDTPPQTQYHLPAAPCLPAVLALWHPLPCVLLHPLLCLCCVRLQLLPRDVERVALPRVLTSIAGLLRSRLHSSRDAAREVLADVSLELGPEYLTHILQ